MPDSRLIVGSCVNLTPVGRPIPIAYGPGGLETVQRQMAEASVVQVEGLRVTYPETEWRNAMPDRQHVYYIIDGERQYQIDQTANPDRPDMVENLSVGDHLLAMEHCLAEARRAWYAGTTPHIAALDQVRKITALGVRCMETYGAPPRQ